MSVTMSGMVPALVAGCLLGGAVWLLVVAVVPPRTDLVSAAGRWQLRRQRYPGAGEEREPAGLGDLAVRLGAWLAREAAARGFQFTGTRANLALLDRTVEQHLVSKVATAAAAFLLPLVASVALTVGGVSVPWVGSVAAGLVLAAVFFVIPDLSVAEQAKEKRSDLRRALACYLDLVAMSLAGGRGVPEALPTAAQIGQGWGFEVLARTVATARSSGVTPWVALGELGERTGIAELQDLGSALTLVASDGAKVRESLAARASSQRTRQLVESEGDAKRAAQSMTIAQVVLFAGFMLFLGYPAVINVLNL